MNGKKRISAEQAQATEKTLVSRENAGPTDAGIMGAHIVETYLTTDGQTLIYEFGNGGGKWYRTKAVQLRAVR
jgi:hypothetical protein